MDLDISEWINVISKPQEKIGSHAICPFAKLANRFEVIKVEKDIIPPQRDFEVVIFLLGEILQTDLHKKCDELNLKYPEFIFLPDHKDNNTFINGVQTNNGKNNLILCQPKNKLREARKSLNKTNYYSFWDKKYLKDILGNDYGNLD
jgi:hypothetical protein